MGNVPFHPQLQELMEDQCQIWRCQRVIPNEVEAGRQILEEIVGQLKAHRWNCRDLFSVRLATEEALVNAIRHGNGRDPAKHVKICCRLSCDRVRIEITDEGQGFDPAAVPDPTDPAHLQLPSGRGLMLMRAFMSRVEIADSGRQLILEKDRQGAA